MSKVVDGMVVDQLCDKNQFDSVKGHQALYEDPVASFDQDLVEKPIIEKEQRTKTVRCESEPAPVIRCSSRCDDRPKNSRGHNLADTAKLK